MKPKRCDKLWPFTGPIPDGQRPRCTLERGHAGLHTIIPPSGMDYAPDDEPGIEPPKVHHQWTDAIGVEYRIIYGPAPMGLGLEEREAPDEEWRRSAFALPAMMKRIVDLDYEIKRLVAQAARVTELNREGMETLRHKLREDRNELIEAAKEVLAHAGSEGLSGGDYNPALLRLAVIRLKEEMERSIE